MPTAFSFALTGLLGLLLLVLALVFEHLPIKPLFRIIPLLLGLIIAGLLVWLATPLKGLLAGLGIVVGLILASLRWESRLGNYGALIAFFGLSHALLLDPILFSYLALGTVLGLSGMGMLVSLQGEPFSWDPLAAVGLLAAGVVWGDRVQSLYALYPLVLLGSAGVLGFLKDRKLDPYPPYLSLLIFALLGWLFALLFGTPGLPVILGALTVAVLVLFGGTSRWPTVLLVGLLLVLASRLFGMYGVAVAGLAFLLVPLPLFASVFAARALFQLYLFRTGLQGAGVDITQVYTFAALAIALLTPFALLELRPFLEDRLLFAVGGLALLLFPLLLGSLASLMPLGAYLGGLVIALLVLGTYRVGFEGLPALALANAAISVIAAPWLISVLALPRQPRAIGFLALAIIGLGCLCYAYYRRPVSAS